MHSIVWLALLGVAAAHQLPFSAPAHTSARLLTDDFDAFARDLLAEWGVPGLALGVVRFTDNDTRPTFDLRSYGGAGRDRKVDGDTLFGIASNSKRLMLPHHSHEHSYQLGESHEEFVKRIAGLRPSAEFRTEWQYNNQMYITAAYLVSKISGQDFTSFVKSSFFEPLGMDTTTYTPLLDERDTLEHLSASYNTLKNRSVVEIPYNFNASREQLQVLAGAGGVVSSLRDLMRWVSFLVLQRRASPSAGASLEKILSQASLKRMTDGHMVQEVAAPYPEGSAVQYSLGLMSASYQGVEFYKHGGDIPGFGTQIMWSPAAGVGIVALCNADGTGNAVADVASYRAFEELLGLKQIDWDARYREKAATARAESDAQLARVFAPARGPSSLHADLIKLIGTYHDYGYGNITVCPSPSASIEPSSLPPACHALFHRLDGLLSTDDTPPPPPNALLIDAPGFFGFSHYVLHHDAGAAWKGVKAAVFGAVEGREQGLLVYVGGGGVRMEVQEDGALRFWGIWGAGPEVEKREKARREAGEWGRAEVEFVRV